MIQRESKASAYYGGALGSFNNDIVLGSRL